MLKAKEEKEAEKKKRQLDHPMDMGSSMYGSGAPTGMA
jgi:hypothetical protein